MNVRGFLLLLVFTSILYSSPLENAMPTGTETSSSNALIEIIFDYAIPIALLISYSIVALAFMASKVFNSRDAESWAKLELREVLISTMYAALIISFFPVFTALTNDFVKSTTSYPNSEIMFIQLLDTSFQPVKSTMDFLFMFASLNWVGWNPTAIAGIPPLTLVTVPVVNLNYSHFYDGKGFINLFSLFAHTFIPILFSAMVSIMGQIVILNFFEKILFVFIGFALAMRSFTFTRKMGSTLLAIILGTFFLFKLLLIIESSVYLNLGLNDGIELTGGADFQFFEFISSAISLLMEGMLQLFEVINFPLYLYQFIVDCVESIGKGNPFAYVICIVFAPFMWIIDLILAVLKIVVGVIFWAVTIVSMSVMGVVTLTDVVNHIIINSIALYSDVITFAFFMPILNFIIIIAGIKSLAETFGGDPTVVNMLSFI